VEVSSATTCGAVSCGAGQNGGERRRLPRGRWQRLPTKAVETPVLLKAHGARQRDGMWHVTCPTVSVRRARAEETATDWWARLYFVISKHFNHPNFEIQIGVLPDVQNSQKVSGREFETQGETLLFGPTSKSNWIAYYKFWNKLKFEFSRILKGYKTFWNKPCTTIWVTCTI
jgi:hypothetical protein